MPERIDEWGWEMSNGAEKVVIDAVVTWAKGLLAEGLDPKDVLQELATKGGATVLEWAGGLLKNGYDPAAELEAMLSAADDVADAAVREKFDEP